MGIGLALKYWTKSLNFALCALVTLLFIVYDKSIHVSTNLLSFLPDGKGKEAFELYNHFKNSKEILVASEGFTKESLARIKAIETQFTQEGNLSLESAIAPNQSRLAYTKTYAFYLKSLHTDTHSSLHDTLTKLHDSMTSNPYYLSIDTSDPLGYFTPKEQKISLSIRDGHLALGNYGYMSVFSLKDTSGSIESYQTAYDYVHHALQGMENIRLFSPTFYFVENSQKIQDDITFLVILSTVLLLALYIFIIRNIALLLNTIATLATSALISYLLVGFIWGEVSVFVLAFGNAIGTLAIDYMFHYYFYGHYEHNKGFSRSVLYGFLTTCGGFLLFSWVDFPLIQQVCVFAIISLFCSYIQFVFIFPYIGFKKAQPYGVLHVSIKLPYRAIAIASLIAIVALSPFLHLDTDIKHLDYQNIPLQKEEHFFKKSIKKESSLPIVLEASSLDELIARARLVEDKFKNASIPLAYVLDKSTFEAREKALRSLALENKRLSLQQEATAIGFREGLFANAYNDTALYPAYKALDIATLKTMGFDVVEKSGTFFTYGLIERHEQSLLSSYPFITAIDAKEIFIGSLQTIMHQLLIGGALAVAFIVGMLFFTCKNSLTLSASFVLLPTALIIVSCLIGGFSIAHLFMLFITMLFGIDFGIYMSSKESFSDGTRSAIFFSIVDTFAGFGVLVFSDIGALHDMGLVSCIGTGAILVLLMGKK